MTAVEDVDQQSEAKPDHEAEPCDDGEASHQAAAQNNRNQREPRYQRHSEDPRTVRLSAAEDDHTQRDEDEREERADVREVGGIADGEDPRRNADYESGDPSRHVRRFELGMDERKHLWKQAVSRHGVP